MACRFLVPQLGPECTAPAMETLGPNHWTARSLDSNNFVKQLFSRKSGMFHILQISFICISRKKVDSHNWCDVNCHVTFEKLQCTFMRVCVNKIISYCYENGFMGLIPWPPVSELLPSLICKLYEQLIQLSSNK